MRSLDGGLRRRSAPQWRRDTGNPLSLLPPPHSVTAWESSPSALQQGQHALPLRSPSGVQGAQPPPGVQRVPLFWKTSEGGPGGTTAQAKPDPPPKEGTGHNKTIRPGYAPPYCKIRTIVLWYPMKSANGLLLFLGACRIHEHWGLTTENPPMAEALREQPKGQDPPRKAGTGANAVVRHRLFGAIPLRDASATGTRPIRDASATGTRPTRDASATAARHNRDASVPAPPEIRLTILTTYNQRSNPPPYSGQVRLGANPFISACRNAENPPSTQLS